MKQSDIIAIVLVGMIGVGVSWVGVNQFLGNPDDAQVSFKTIELVNADLDTPDPEVFNADAINPTVEVYIGSCEDADGDGVLSQAERVACGQVKDSNTENDEQNEEQPDVTIPTPTPTVAPVTTPTNVAIPTLEPTMVPETTEVPEEPIPTDDLVEVEVPEVEE